MRPIEREIMYDTILQHQSAIEDIILQNWIATQQLAQSAPAFQPK